MTQSTKAYAKINLYLDVVGKRSDGYHEIESVMQQVTLSDTVSVDVSESLVGTNKICITCSDASVPTDRRNIAYKCAEEFFRFYSVSGIKAVINIDKKIPLAGGLAGGSTDGAAVLKLLNEMTAVNASEEELRTIGAKIGADIPFCISGGSCICRGIGEQIEKINLPCPTYHVLVAVSGEGVSTPKAYQMIDEIKIKASHSIDGIISDIEKGFIPKNMYNAFEEVILPRHSYAGKLKNKLLSLGADAAMMSGSGPSVFGLFRNIETLEKAYSAIADLNIRAYPCEVVI